VSGLRLLLLLPHTTYRAAAFVTASRGIGVQLTVATDHRSTLEAGNPEGFLALDFDDPEAAAARAREFASRYPVHAVFGVDDDTVLLAAHLAAALGLPHIAPGAALAARDKLQQRRLLAAAGLPVPEFALHHFGDDLERAARETVYPAVLKPLRLAASRGVIRADDAGQFVAAAERIRRILAEPETARHCGETAGCFLAEGFVPGAEVALEGLMAGGALRVLALFDKPDALDGPFFEETIYVTPSRLGEERRREVAGVVEAAARVMGIERGPLHAEVRINDAGVWLIEVAARPIGGRCGAVLRFGPGGAVSLEELHLRAALGEDVSRLGREEAAAAVMMIPNPGEGRLEEVGGLAAARAVPGVAEVTITAHRGQLLVPLPESSRYPGFIFARAAEPEAAEAAVREAHRMLRFHLLPP
jgi:biotin carboxylase